MAKFRKKPVVVEAERWFRRGDVACVETEAPVDKENCLWPDFTCPQCGRLLEDHGRIKTLEGSMVACPGDWIITGIKGELYPCKPDIFEATYEPVD